MKLEYQSKARLILSFIVTALVIFTSLRVFYEEGISGREILAKMNVSAIARKDTYSEVIVKNTDIIESTLTVENPPVDNIELNQNTEETISEEVIASDSAYISGFRVIMQDPELPSGCEVTSLAMVLNYLGYPVSKTDLADNYLPQGEIGDDYYNKMIGNPRQNYSLGCFAPAIVTCANNYGITHSASDISYSDLDTLCDYVRNGHPVIVWATENMRVPFEHTMWEYNGVHMGYLRWQHCMVMIGYNRDTDEVIMADPLRGEVTYNLSTFYNRYQSIYSQAVVII